MTKRIIRVGKEPPVLVQKNDWFSYEEYERGIKIKNTILNNNIRYAICKKDIATNQIELLFGGFELEQDALVTLMMQSRCIDKNKCKLCIYAYTIDLKNVA